MSSTETNLRRVITPLARLSYPNLFKPAKAMNDGEKEKYQCELIFAPGTDLSELKKAAAEAVREKWGNKAPKNLRSPFRKGDEEREDKDGYEGCIFISARSSDKPGIVIGRNKDICSDESQVYGGCYVRVSVTAFGYETKGNKGVAFALNHVWKIKDGEPFGGRRSAEDEFNDIEMDEDAFGEDVDLLGDDQDLLGDEPF